LNNRETEVSTSQHGRSRYFGSRPMPSSEPELYTQRKTEESAAYWMEGKTSRHPTERSIVFACLQLAIRIGRSIPKHEVGLLINPTVDVFKRSRGQDAPRGILITTMNERVPNKRTPLTEKRSLALELQADVAVRSPRHPKQIIHCKKKEREKRTMISSTVR